jgi:hypothetical protein
MLRGRRTVYFHVHGTWEVADSALQLIQHPFDVVAANPAPEVVFGTDTRSLRREVLEGSSEASDPRIKTP